MAVGAGGCTRAHHRGGGMKVARDLDRRTRAVPVAVHRLGYTARCGRPAGTEHRRGRRPRVRRGLGADALTLGASHCSRQSPPSTRVCPSLPTGSGASARCSSSSSWPAMCTARRTGFSPGSVAWSASAVATGGIGPWLPYEMFGCGFVGLIAGLAGLRRSGSVDLARRGGARHGRGRYGFRLRRTARRLGLDHLLYR